MIKIGEVRIIEIASPKGISITAKNHATFTIYPRNPLK